MLALNEEIAQSVDIIAKAFGQLAPNGAYLHDDRIFRRIHGRTE